MNTKTQISKFMCGAFANDVAMTPVNGKLVYEPVSFPAISWKTTNKEQELLTALHEVLCEYEHVVENEWGLDAIKAMHIHSIQETEGGSKAYELLNAAGMKTWNQLRVKE